LTRDVLSNARIPSNPEMAGFIKKFPVIPEIIWKQCDKFFKKAILDMELFIVSSLMVSAFGNYFEVNTKKLILENLILESLLHAQFDCTTIHLYETFF
jgi:hypothetical protein